jgi:hypothetical protein
VKQSFLNSKWVWTVVGKSIVQEAAAGMFKSEDSQPNSEGQRRRESGPGKNEWQEGKKR